MASDMEPTTKQEREHWLIKARNRETMRMDTVDVERLCRQVEALEVERDSLLAAMGGRQKND